VSVKIGADQIVTSTLGTIQHAVLVKRNT